MKKYYNLLLAIIVLAANAFSQDGNTVRPDRKTAWLKGIGTPGDTGGIKMAILNFQPPEPGSTRLVVILQTTKATFSLFRDQAASGDLIPGLRLVVRKDAVTGMDESYGLVDGHIDSVRQVKKVRNLVEAVVNFRFTRVVKEAGVKLQPGPPADAPSVLPFGMNQGWICEQPTRDSIRRRAVEIVDFIAPDVNGRLIVQFGNIPAGEQWIIKPVANIPKLILVLPDRSALRYVEYKLWNVRIGPVPGREGLVSFEADFIDCLTGTHLPK